MLFTRRQHSGATRPSAPDLACSRVCTLALFVAAGCGDAPAPRVASSPGPPAPSAAPPVSIASPEAPGYDPLAFARATLGVLDNPEAVIPPQCYTKTESRFNPCWTCHASATRPNAMWDSNLQAEYAFSDEGMTNAWRNLFEDHAAELAAISDAEALAYVREDNYEALRRALAELPKDEYPGYRPDLELERGFDPQGFAVDGSDWRAFRYKPFLGTFWPTNGSTDDVMIRLPPRFRQSAQGEPSRAAYQINLAILEAAIASDPKIPAEELTWPTEPLDERAAGRDLNGDGAITTGVTALVGLPSHYVGGAGERRVRRGVYPEETEFLHSVRYIDPDAPGMIAARMKELRYSKKVKELELWAIQTGYRREVEEKEEGSLPTYAGSPFVGLRNEFGWQLQGFIEDARGRLRLQSKEEHMFCMGCHSTISVTVDQTFAFARKVPGAPGWAYQDIAGIPDVPQLGHSEPETLTYFRRVGGGDEFRANAEVLARFFPGGELDEAEVRRAAPGGDKDLRHLVAPSTERALLLNKAAMVRARLQGYARGRDAVIAPLANVHAAIEEESTGLKEAGKVYLDGRLRLDWGEPLAPR